MAKRARELEWKFRCDAVILMGDFNETVAGEPYRTLVSVGLADTWLPGSQSVASFHGWIGPRASEDRIDWILLRGKLVSKRSFLSVDKFDSSFWPSDHFPLAVDLAE